jgi:predicted lipoprotein with Yx(FWY)xxD motif
MFTVASHPRAVAARTREQHIDQKEALMRIGRGSLVVGLCALVGAGAVSASGGALVKVETTGPLGKVVANSHGHTLYMFRADHGKTSACYGACATYWPPLLTSGKPIAGPGVKASLLTTAKRKDGKLQVMYKGHLLYTFLLDKKAGQTKGEGSKNFGASWYALRPSGAVIDKD